MQNTEKITLADGSNGEKSVRPTEHDVRTWQEAHKRRNANLFSLLLTNIVNNNLVRMLSDNARGDGYKAWKLLKALSYREPDDLSQSLL